VSAPSASARPFDRAATVRAAEWAYLASVVLGWAIFVISRGEDRAWDFRNYHWYIPYAFLHGRMAIDVAVAHQATFYNPFLDIPFYWLATHTHSWIALGVLGALQGANVVPLYLIVRSVLLIEQRVLASVILSLLCMTGSLTLYLAGTTYYDNVMSVFVLSGLAIVIVNRDRLRVGSLWASALIAFAAGVLVGSAMGLKLPEAPFAVGFAAALAVLPGDAKHRATRLLGGGLGGVIGVALFAGYWFVKMAHLTGNPLFPYFNQFFHSPLALTASYRDVRFIPTHLKTELLFPLLFSIDWGVADDLPFHDIRVGLAYVLVIASLAMAVFVARPRQRIVAADAACALIAFVAVSYIAWLKIFGIYRYLSQRAPVGDPYIQVTIPPIAHTEKTMILMTGETPMGFLAPSFPSEIPIVRIDGWMIAPKDGSRLTADTKTRVAAFPGDLYVVFNPFEAARNKDALKDYGLAIVPAKCRDIVTNLGGPYAFCPLTKATPTTTNTP